MKIAFYDQNLKGERKRVENYAPIIIIVRTSETRRRGRARVTVVARGTDTRHVL